MAETTGPVGGRFKSWAEDYVARPQRVNPELVRAVMKRRGLTTRMAARGDTIRRSGGVRHDVAGARIVVEEHDAAHHRASDPLERALTFLRGRGYVPVCKESTFGVEARGTGYRIGRRANLTTEEAIALAVRNGFEPERSEAHGR